MFEYCIRMSTSIRVSDDTKRMQERPEREDETSDDLLERLVQSEEPIEIGGWNEEEADRARAGVKRSRESFERWRSSMVPASSTCLRASQTWSRPSKNAAPLPHVRDLCIRSRRRDGRMRGETDVVGVRQQFGGVRSLDLNEHIALEAARMQDASMDDGERVAVRDLLVAATARSTGDELVVADGDFETGIHTGLMDVTNLRRNDFFRASDTIPPPTVPARLPRVCNTVIPEIESRSRAEYRA